MFHLVQNAKIEEIQIEEDIIIGLSTKGLYHILEQIYFHLPLNAIRAFKKVSPQWKDIISSLQTSKIPRLRQITDRNINKAWKSEKPTLLESSFNLPKLMGAKFLVDARHVIIAGRTLPMKHCRSDILIFDSKTLEYIRQICAANLKDLKMNENYLVALVQKKDSTMESQALFIWNRSQKFPANTTWTFFPWTESNPFNHVFFSADDFLNCAIKDPSTSNVIFRKTSLSNHSIETSKPIKMESGYVAFAVPLLDGSDNLLVLELLNQKWFYSRYDAVAGCLWKVAKQPFELLDWNDEFLVMKNESTTSVKLDVVRMADGKIEQSLDFTKKLAHIHVAHINGGRIAINGLTIIDSSDVTTANHSRDVTAHDVIVVDRRTGETLLECRHHIDFSSSDIPLRNDFDFHLEQNKLVLRAGEQLYSLNFDSV